KPVVGVVVTRTASANAGIISVSFIRILNAAASVNDRGRCSLSLSAELISGFQVGTWRRRASQGLCRPERAGSIALGPRSRSGCPRELSVHAEGDDARWHRPRG